MVVIHLMLVVATMVKTGEYLFDVKVRSSWKFVRHTMNVVASVVMVVAAGVVGPYQGCCSHTGH